MTMDCITVDPGRMAGGPTIRGHPRLEKHAATGSADRWDSALMQSAWTVGRLDPTKSKLLIGPTPAARRR